ncbi:MAG TPA: hypothetical protein VKF59_22520 [Candidatus Dormibacteraeota bacterium]|nr:hypothetical protein [Candidatus Dormibacteraeota bacterium]
MTALWRFVGRVLVVALTVGVAAVAGQAFFDRIGSVPTPVASRPALPAYRPAGAPSAVAAVPPSVRSELPPARAPVPTGAPAPHLAGPAPPSAPAAVVAPLGTAPAELQTSQPALEEAVKADVHGREAGRDLRSSRAAVVASATPALSGGRHNESERDRDAHRGSTSLREPGAAPSEPDGAGEGARRALSSRTQEPP